MGDISLESKRTASRARNLSCHVLGGGEVNVAERDVRPTFCQNTSSNPTNPRPRTSNECNFPLYTSHVDPPMPSACWRRLPSVPRLVYAASLHRHQSPARHSHQR